MAPLVCAARNGATLQISNNNKLIELGRRLRRLAPRDEVLACVEIKFRAPHAIDAMLSP